jgi:hypothetical protein
MSFYVTLPSNASLDLYDNKMSNFTTKLNTPLKFNIPYEVALVEITFKERWLSNVGHLTYRRANKFFVTLPILHVDASHLYRTINALPKLFNKLIKVGHPEIPEENLPRIIVSGDHLSFECDDSDAFFFEGPINHYLHLNEPILFTNKSKPGINIAHTHTAFYHVNSLYIYSDIIKFQYVGDTLSPLLRNVQVGNHNHGITTITYNTPHYISLDYTFIDTINISIRDDIGQFIKFLPGKNIVKLHFRPIRYGL